MTMNRRPLAALAAALWLATPALAATPQPLTSAWSKIASAGSCVTVSTSDSTGAVQLATSTGVPAASETGRPLQFFAPTGGTLNADLYARGPAGSTIAVDTGLCPGGGGGSGGGGGGVATQGQSNDGTSPWNVKFPVPPLVYLNGSGANSSNNPFYAAITNLPATQPVSGTVSVNNFPATQAISGSVTFSGNLPGFASPPAMLPGSYNTTLPTLANGAAAAVALDVNGRQLIQGGNSQAVKTDGSAVTQPVSGSVALTGTLPAFTAPPNVLVGVYNSTLPTLSSGTQAAVALDANGKQLVQGGNSVAVKVDGSSTTQPVSMASAAPLSPNAATENGNLATLVTAINNLNTKIDTLNTNMGAKADPPYDGSTVSLASQNGLLKLLATSGYPATVPGTESAYALMTQGCTNCIPTPALIKNATSAPIPTAPQAAVPSTIVTGTLSSINDAVTISGVDGYNTIQVEATGSASWTGTTIVETQGKSGTWYTTKIGDFEGNAAGVSALPTATAAQLFFKTGGVQALRIRAVSAITNGPLTISLTAMNGLKDLRVSAPVGNPLSAQLAFNGAAASLANAYPMQLAVGTAAASAANPLATQLSQGNAALSAANPLPSAQVVGGAVVSATNPSPVANIVGGAVVASGNPMPSSNPSLAPQRSTALETCHTFSKAVTATALRTMAVSGQSSSPLWLFLLDLSAPPSSATSQAANVLLAPVKMGSDGSSFQGQFDFSAAPVLSSAGFTACLSTTAYPTYTAAGAIGAYTGQLQ